MNRFWHRASGSLHRWVGATVSIVLVALAASGLLLMHPAWTGQSADRTLSLVVDPDDADHVLRGTEQGLLRSEDGGATWTEVQLMVPLTQVVALEWAPDDPDLVYAATRLGDLVKSTDGGWIWEPVRRDGLPPRGEMHVRQLAVGASGRMLLGTDQFVYATDTGGLSWSATGPSTDPDLALRDFLHDLHTGRLFGRVHGLVNDATAVAVVLLVLTGWLMWTLRLRARRRPAADEDARSGWPNAAKAGAAAALLMLLLLALMLGPVLAQ